MAEVKEEPPALQKVKDEPPALQAEVKENPPTVQEVGVGGTDACAITAVTRSDDPVASLDVCEEDTAGHDAGSKRPQEGSDQPPASKRAKHEKKEPKKEEPVPGHRKFLLSGITGIKQEVLQGQLDRSGIPYNKIWKARNKDTGEIWLKDNAVFLKVLTSPPPQQVLHDTQLTKVVTDMSYCETSGVQVRAKRNQGARSGSEDVACASRGRGSSIAPGGCG